MEHVDLNLEHYNKSELEQFFHLPPDYTTSDIQLQSELVLKKMAPFPTEFQTKVFQFVQRAREQLVSFLIPPPTTPVMYTNPSEYFPGTLNPVEKRLVSKIVCLDSLFRMLYKTTVATDSTFSFEPMKKVVSMKLSRLNLPPILAFTTGMNTFSITTLTETTTCTIPDGNYTASEMVNLLASVLPVDTTCTIDPVTLKCTFAHPLAFTLTWPTNLNRLFGFTDDEYTGATSYTSEGVYDPLDKYVFVDVDDFQNNFVTNTVVSNLPEGYLGKNVMARVSLNTTDLDFCTREYFGPVRLDKLKIKLVNRFGAVVQLGGFDYSISFEFKEWYG